MAQQQTPIAVDASELSDAPQTPAAPVAKPVSQPGKAPIPVNAQELSDTADPFSAVGGTKHIDLNNLIGPQLSTSEKFKRDPGLPLRDKIREIENYTVEGRQTHPILAKLGDYLRNVYVPGGESPSTPTTEMGPGWAQAKPLSEMTPQEQDEYLKAHPPLAQPVPPAPGLSAGLASAAEEGAARTGAAEAAAVGTVPKPGLIKKLVQGADVGQPQAQAAIRTAAQNTAASAGISTAAPQSMHELLSDPINALEAQAKQNYKAMDEVTGGRFQPVVDSLKNANDKLRNSIEGTPEYAEAQAAKTRLEWQQEALFDQAAKAGVPKTVVENARAQFRQAQALRELESKVFQNPNNITGDIAHGTPEQVNLNQVIKSLFKMDKDTTWGSSRLEQALGSPEAAKNLMDDLHAAQRLGVQALNTRKIAELIGGGIIGIGSVAGIYESAKSALGR